MPTIDTRLLHSARPTNRSSHRGVGYQGLDRAIDMEMTAPTAVSIPSSGATFDDLDLGLRQHIYRHLSPADLARLSMVNEKIYGDIQQAEVWRRRVEASSQVPACREILAMQGWKLSDLRATLSAESIETEQVLDTEFDPFFYVSGGCLAIGGFVCLDVGCLGSLPSTAAAWLSATGALAGLGAAICSSHPWFAHQRHYWFEHRVAAASSAFERARDDAVKAMAEMETIRSSGRQASSSRGAAHADALRLYAKHLYRYNQTAALAIALDGKDLGILEQILPETDESTRLDSLADPEVLSSVFIAAIWAKRYRTAELLIRRGASPAIADPHGMLPTEVVQQQAQAAARAGRWDDLNCLLALPVAVQLTSKYLPADRQGPGHQHGRVVAIFEGLVEQTETQEDAKALCRLLTPSALGHRECHSRLLASAITSGRSQVALALWDFGARLRDDTHGDQARAAAEGWVRTLEAAGRRSAAHRMGRLVALA